MYLQEQRNLLLLYKDAHKALPLVERKINQPLFALIEP